VKKWIGRKWIGYSYFQMLKFYVSCKRLHLIINYLFEKILLKWWNYKSFVSDTLNSASRSPASRIGIDTELAPASRKRSASDSFMVSA